MRQIIFNYRTDEELVSSLGSAFIAVNFLNFRRSFIIGKQCLGSSASWAMAIATISIIIIFYLPYLHNTKNLFTAVIVRRRGNPGSHRAYGRATSRLTSFSVKIRTKINGAVKFVYVKLQNVLLSKFLSLTYPFLSLIPCDRSQETATSVMHEFAAIIHYCVRRTRCRFDQCGTQKKLLRRTRRRRTNFGEKSLT